MVKKSFRQRAAYYWMTVQAEVRKNPELLKNNPDKLATQISKDIGVRYRLPENKSKNLSMRDSDRNSLVKGLVYASKFNHAMRNSNANPSTIERTTSQSYLWAIKGSKKGKEIYPVEGKHKYDTMESTYHRTFDEMNKMGFERYNPFKTDKDRQKAIKPRHPTIIIFNFKGKSYNMSKSMKRHPPPNWSRK